MFDDDHRRLVQVASIANAIAAAENASPWRALLWLAEQAEAGNLAPRLFTTVTMNTVDAAPSSPEHSLRIWRKMAQRTQAERAKNMLHYHLPATASTWHVHARDLMQFAMAAKMPDPVRAQLLELARQHGGTALAQPAVQEIRRESIKDMADNERRVREAIAAECLARGIDAVPPFKPGKQVDPFKADVQKRSGLGDGAFKHAWSAVTKGMRPLKRLRTG